MAGLTTKKGSLVKCVKNAWNEEGTKNRKVPI